MNEEICGLMVVRHPVENIYPNTSICRIIDTPSFGNIYYGGVDRMPWFDIDELYYEGKLPNHLERRWEQLRGKFSSNFTGLILVRSLKDIRLLYQELNPNLITKNEIIALYSSKLKEIIGTYQTTLNLQWLGVDPKCLGEWSLLSEGLFLFPNKFPFLVDYINESGLFNDEGICQRYVELYLKLAARNEVEEIGLEPYGIDYIKIWRAMSLGSLFSSYKI